MFSLDGMDIMDSAARSGLYEHDYYSAIRDYIKEADGLMAYYSENGEHYGSNYDEPADSTPIKRHRNNSTFLCTRQWRAFNKQP